MSEVKEWVKVSCSARGETVVTVSLVDGNLTSKYAAKSYQSSVKDDVFKARQGARRQLNALRAALDELGEL